MFWKVFKALCDSVGKTPNAIIKENKWGGTSAATNWKSGKIPNVKTLLQIAAYFGVTVEYLLTGENPAPAVQQGNGVTEAQREIIDWVLNLTPEQAEVIRDTMVKK